MIPFMLYLVIIVMNNYPLKDHLFFKKQIFQKLSEPLLMFGVDEYFEDELGSVQSLSDSWEYVEYLAKTHEVSHSQFSTLLKKAKLSQENYSPSYLWLIRKDQALVDFYKSTQLISQQDNGWIKAISEINCRWEFQGIHIISMLTNHNQVVLLYQIKQKIYEFKCKQIAQPSLSVLLLKIKSCILVKVLSGLQINCQQDIALTINQLSVQNKIMMAYRLNEEYELTLKFDQQFKIIPDKLLVRSTPTTYASTITCLVSICSQIVQQITFKHRLMQVVQCSQQQMFPAFQRLYESILQSKAKYD